MTFFKLEESTLSVRLFPTFFILLITIIFR